MPSSEASKDDGKGMTPREQNNKPRRTMGWISTPKKPNQGFQRTFPTPRMVAPVNMHPVEFQNC